MDSWKDKRMTGFRLSWRIENENPPLIANISKVGRSIETPHFGDTPDETTVAPSAKVYKVTLTPPQNLAQQTTNKSFVIDLDINKKPSDEVYAFTSFKLHKEKKSWTDADLHCKSEGGQLASIHTQWEQTLAEKAAEGEEFVWLGGSNIDGQWQWADNATLRFGKWREPEPGPESYGYVMMDSEGQWFNQMRWPYFLSM